MRFPGWRGSHLQAFLAAATLKPWRTHVTGRAITEDRMAGNAQKIGWIGMGRMGFPMAERLLKAGHDVSIWNRTRAKAEPLAKVGGKVVDKLSDLASCDVVFSIVSTGKDLDEVYFGEHGVV